MEKVSDAGITIDPVTVGDQLQRDIKLDSIIMDVFSGRPAISKMRDSGNPRMAESYAYTVLDYFGKRQTYEAGKQIAIWSKNGRRAIDISADGRKMLDEVDLLIGSGNARTVDAKTAASRTYDISVRASKGEIKSVKTGLFDLDKILKMRPKTLTIMAGRPGQGKSAFVDTVAINHAMNLFNSKTKGMVLILSLEMSVEQVTARLLSHLCGVPTTQILDGEMDADEWLKYNNAIEYFEQLPLKINDIPSLSIGAIRTETRRYLKDDEDNLLIVDYIQLATSGQNKQNRVDEVGVISRGLKVLANEGEKGLAVLAAAQLSRAIEQRADKRPVMSDLRESGSLEQEADNILFLYSDSDSESLEGGSIQNNIKKVIVAKQRNGATSAEKGDIELRWNAPIMRFENLSIERIELN
jgi:replicative DNA helicase